MLIDYRMNTLGKKNWNPHLFPHVANLYTSKTFIQ